MAVSTLVDRVKVYVLSSGIGPFQLGGAVAAYRGIEALVDGATYSYATESGSTYEVGTGVYVAGSGQFVRSPLFSSNGNAAVPFPANIELVFTLLSQDLSARDLGAKANAAAIGINPEDDNLGDFTDGIIPDGSTAKEALEALDEHVSKLEILNPINPPYNGSGGGAANDTVPVNNATADSGYGGSILLPPGSRFQVTDWANDRGVRGEGGGQIFTGTLPGARQLNLYANAMDFVVGREYADRLFRRVGNTGTTLSGFMFSDSTFARGNTTIVGGVDGTTLTVTNAGTATLCPGTFITSIPGSPQIMSQSSGTPFGAGVYVLSAPGSISSGSTINIGNGGGFAGDAGEPQALIPALFRQNGVRNGINLVNLGIGGTNWSQCDPVPYVGATTDIMFFKYGINPVASPLDIDAEIAAMRTVLQNVRSQTFGTSEFLTIVLISPTSTYDPSGGRTNIRYELMRQAYEWAAREFECVFIDLYGAFPDSFHWAGRYADNPAVHPNGFLQQQLCAFIADALFPAGSLQLSTGDLWVPLSLQNGWAPYGNGYADPAAMLTRDGFVFLRGAIGRASGTPTAGQPMALLPNSNYYSPFSDDRTITTFDGSTWSVVPLSIDTGGVISPRNNQAQNGFVSFNGISWRVY